MGLPLLENGKGVLVFVSGFLVSKMFYVYKIYSLNITKDQFHVFARYEFHIQVFSILFNQSVSFTDPPLHKCIYTIYSNFKKNVRVPFTKFRKFAQFQIPRYETYFAKMSLDCLVFFQVW